MNSFIGFPICKPSQKKSYEAKAYMGSLVIYFDYEIYYGPLEKPLNHIFSSYSITIFNFFSTMSWDFLTMRVKAGKFSISISSKKI